MSTAHNVSSSSSGGVGFTGLLQVAFIVLKLTKAIDWSWWWVLSPTWVTAGFALVLMLLVGLAMLIGALVEWRK